METVGTDRKIVDARRVNRRKVLLLGALATLSATPFVRAASSKFVYKCGTGMEPNYPVNIRLQEAFDRIYKKTDGELSIKLYPAGQLGSDTDRLYQLRGGSLESTVMSTSIFATLVPVCGIVNTGYAFLEYKDVWKAMDGHLGKYIQAQLNKVGLAAHVKIWDNGFRQITSSTRDVKVPSDLAGFKIRTPPAPMLTSLFRALGASPTPMNFAELYSALQTRVVDGQENALSLIWSSHFYEVQKYCSLTSHSWDGYWPVFNGSAWDKLPDDIKKVVAAEFDHSANDERRDIEKVDKETRTKLSDKGMDIHDVDKKQFRDALSKTDYYKTWKQKYGEEAWGQLEAATGKLV